MKTFKTHEHIDKNMVKMDGRGYEVLKYLKILARTTSKMLVVNRSLVLTKTPISFFFWNPSSTQQYHRHKHPTTYSPGLIGNLSSLAEGWFSSVWCVFVITGLSLCLLPAATAVGIWPQGSELNFYYFIFTRLHLLQLAKVNTARLSILGNNYI